jgi:hypothetical protein
MSWRVEKRSKIDLTLGWKQTYGLVDSQAVATASDSTGLYVVGTTLASVGDNETQGWEIRMINFSDGSVSWTQTPASQANYKVTGITLQGIYLYVVGREVGADYQWRIERRLKSDGSLDWAVNYP